jgi:hypothetical protein
VFKVKKEIVYIVKMKIQWHAYNSILEICTRIKAEVENPTEMNASTVVYGALLWRCPPVGVGS